MVSPSTGGPRHFRQRQLLDDLPQRGQPPIHARRRAGADAGMMVRGCVETRRTTPSLPRREVHHVQHGKMHSPVGSRGCRRPRFTRCDRTRRTHGAPVREVVPFCLYTFADRCFSMQRKHDVVSPEVNAGRRSFRRARSLLCASDPQPQRVFQGVHHGALVRVLVSCVTTRAARTAQWQAPRRLREIAVVSATAQQRRLGLKQVPHAVVRRKRNQRAVKLSASARTGLLEEGWHDANLFIEQTARLAGPARSVAQNRRIFSTFFKI
mmetsp:Transcript_18015/g.45039  ORF Transcript_18015/g.45039 Transcript_18015/m.45039 type:complete len:266 (+) Transcript_18015:5551-6348(+)